MAAQSVMTLISPQADEAILLRSGPLLTPPMLDDVVEERAMTGLCGYPACRSAPLCTAKPNAMTTTIQLVERAREEAAGTREAERPSNFCGAACLRACRHVLSQLAVEHFGDQAKQPARTFTLLQRRREGDAMEFGSCPPISSEKSVYQHSGASIESMTINERAPLTEPQLQAGAVQIGSSFNCHRIEGYLAQTQTPFESATLAHSQYNPASSFSSTSNPESNALQRPGALLGGSSNNHNVAVNLTHLRATRKDAEVKRREQARAWRLSRPRVSPQNETSGSTSSSRSELIAAPLARQQPAPRVHARRGGAAVFREGSGFGALNPHKDDPTVFRPRNNDVAAPSVDIRAEEEAEGNENASLEGSDAPFIRGGGRSTLAADRSAAVIERRIAANKERRRRDDESAQKSAIVSDQAESSPPSTPTVPSATAPATANIAQSAPSAADTVAAIPPHVTAAVLSGEGGGPRAVGNEDASTDADAAVESAAIERYCRAVYGEATTDSDGSGDDEGVGDSSSDEDDEEGGGAVGGIWLRENHVVAAASAAAEVASYTSSAAASRRTPSTSAAGVRGANATAVAAARTTATAAAADVIGIGQITAIGIAYSPAAAMPAATSAANSSATAAAAAASVSTATHTRGKPQYRSRGSRRPKKNDEAAGDYPDDGGEEGERGHEEEEMFADGALDEAPALPVDYSQRPAGMTDGRLIDHVSHSASSQVLPVTIPLSGMRLFGLDAFGLLLSCVSSWRTDATEQLLSDVYSLRGSTTGLNELVSQLRVPRIGAISAGSGGVAAVVACTASAGYNAEAASAARGALTAGGGAVGAPPSLSPADAAIVSRRAYVDAALKKAASSSTSSSSGSDGGGVWRGGATAGVRDSGAPPPFHDVTSGVASLSLGASTVSDASASSSSSSSSASSSSSTALSIAVEQGDDDDVLAAAIHALTSHLVSTFDLSSPVPALEQRHWAALSIVVTHTLRELLMQVVDSDARRRASASATLPSAPASLQEMRITKAGPTTFHAIVDAAAAGAKSPASDAAAAALTGDQFALLQHVLTHGVDSSWPASSQASNTPAATSVAPARSGQSRNATGSSNTAPRGCASGDGDNRVGMAGYSELERAELAMLAAARQMAGLPGVPRVR